MSEKHQKILNRARAKAQRLGVKMGRKPTLSEKQVAALIRRWKRGAARKNLATKFGISVSTVSRILARGGLGVETGPKPPDPSGSIRVR